MVSIAKNDKRQQQRVIYRRRRYSNKEGTQIRIGYSNTNRVLILQSGCVPGKGKSAATERKGARAEEKGHSPHLLRGFASYKTIY